MQALATPRTRGVTAVRNTPRLGGNRDPNQVINEMMDSFDAFKKRHEDDVDRIAADVAALKVGGVGGGSPETAPRTALAALGSFVKTGVVPQAAMSTDNDPKGGFVTPPELDRNITRRQADLSPMRRLASVRQTSAGTYQIPMQATAAGAGWVGEREARPETDTPDLALLSIVTHEIYANPAVTQTMLDDAAVDIGEFLTGEITVAFDELEGDAFVNGDGVNKPRGFLTYPMAADPDATRARGKLQYKETAGSGAVTADDLIDLLYTLRAPYRAGAAWVMNSKTVGTVRKLKDGDGNHIWSVASSAGELPQLLGYPVETDEGMPDIGAGACPVAFGNFKRGYIIADRTGVRLLRDPYTNKPNVHFYTTKRVGGAVHEGSAIKLLKVKA